MRKQALVLALILAAPAIQAQDPQDPVIDDVRLMLGDGEVTSVDIIAEHGDTFTYEIDVEEPDFGAQVILVEFIIHAPTGQIVLRPTRIDPPPPAPGQSQTVEGMETWRAEHPVDDARLVVGEHPVEVKVFDSNGGQAFCPVSSGQGRCSDALSVPDLKVTWDSQGDYTLDARLAHVAQVDNQYPSQDIGVGDQLRTEVSLTSGSTQAPWALRHVQYQISTGTTSTPLAVLRAPYILGPTQFFAGHQDIEVTATDRSGRTSSFSVHAFVDVSPPEVEVSIPSVTYQNVSFEVVLDVDDALPYNATVVIDDVVLTQFGTKVAPVAPYAFTRETLGVGNVLVRVTDDLGNQFLRQFNVTTENAVTDSTIDVQVTPAHPLPEENITVSFVARQQSGVTDLEFNVTLDVERLGQVFREVVEVPLDTPFEFSFERAYLPGQYAFNATILPLQPLFDCGGNVTEPGVCETDDSDQVHVGSFEVFLGKVVKADRTYYIRVDERGQPESAVSPGGAVYPLTLETRGNGTVYAFTASGESLHWDPFQRTTDLTPPEEKDPDEKSPGLPLVVLLVALLGVALRRRK